MFLMLVYGNKMRYFTEDWFEECYKAGKIVWKCGEGNTLDENVGS